MHRRIAGFLLWAVLAWPAAAWALLLEPAAGLHAPVNLVGHLAARCVADGGESIESVAAPARAGEFIALPALLLKGYTHDTCWLRFELQRAAEAPQEWLLEVGMPYLDDVTLFLPSQGRGDTTGSASFQSLRLGDRFPYAARPVPHRLFVFPLHLADTQPLTAYLRIQTSSTMLVETLNIWQYSGLIASTQMETAFSWLVFGLIALGVLSNLVFWLWLREGIYRAYTVYLVTLLVMNLVHSGFASPWLWPQTPLVADRSIGFMAALTFFVGLVFFDWVLGLRWNFPRLGRAIPVFLAIYAAGALAAAAGHWAEVAPLVQVAALTTTIGITVAGPWLLWRGRKHLWLYVLAFSTQLLITIATLSRNLGLWPLEIRVGHFILGATAIHVVLLNFALVGRMRHAQREKNALEKMTARLESEQLALTQQQEFMSMVAHEFRTPLTIIDHSAQRIAGDTRADADKLAERCANIRRAVRRLTALMDEFLTLDRMEGQVRCFSPIQYRVDEIIDAVLAEFPNERIDVRRLDPPEEVTCDPTMLCVALANLLKNALRYSPPDKPICFAAAGRAEGGVVFSVTDHGPGIPADELPKLFQKYFRGRRGQTKPGAGLGLFLVERVTQLHGGSVSVTSQPGEGSRFEISLPGQP